MIKKGCISALHKSLQKQGVENDFVYLETSDVNLLYQLRSKPLIHQRDFHLKYILDILLSHVACFYTIYHMQYLYAISKGLVFGSLVLVPNKIDFVLSCLKCILHLLSTNQSHQLKKFLMSCFSISITHLCWKNIQVPSA